MESFTGRPGQTARGTVDQLLDMLETVFENNMRELQTSALLGNLGKDLRDPEVFDAIVEEQRATWKAERARARQEVLEALARPPADQKGPIV